ncbi:MAG: T9SS type A sorting domain-containing protein [Bacteroidota bacterium]
MRGIFNRLLSGQMCLAGVLVLCGLSSTAQTNPTPNVLKNGDYIFTNFATNLADSVYPASMQGWSGITPANSPTAPTTLQAVGDSPLKSDAIDTTVFRNQGRNGISLRNDNRIGSLALAVGLNTKDCYGVKVAWLSTPIHRNDLSTSSIQLQYRIGVTGNWTNLDNSSDMSGVQNSGFKDFVSTLPAACNNKDTVQLRWIMFIPTAFTSSNSIALSKIHVMPDSIAGQTGYKRAGGNIDSTGVLVNSPGAVAIYNPLYIKEVQGFQLFTMDSLPNNRSGFYHGYSDYTGFKHVLTLATGDQGDLTLIPGNSTITASRTAAFYIDWNQDNDFDDAGEYFPAPALMAYSNHVANITVPAGAKSGFTRMRARLIRTGVTMTPNGPSTDGETEDYKIFVDNLLAPLPDCVAKTAYTPKNDSLICLSTDSLRWTAVTGALGYRVTIIDTISGTKLANQDTARTNAYSVAGLLTSGKVYKWIAVTYSASGDALACDTVIFKTSANSDPVADALPMGVEQLCMGDKIQLSGGASSGTAPYKHSWNGIKNTLLSDTAVADPFFNGNTTPGLYTYYYTVKDANGCTAKDSVKLQVNELPLSGTLDFITANKCAGESDTLELRGSTGTVRVQQAAAETGPWTTSSVTPITDTTFSTGPLSDTTYYRVITTKGSCTDTSKVLMVPVKPNPEKPVVTFTKTEFCIGDSAQLTVINHTSGITWNDANATQATSIVVYQKGSFIATATKNGCRTSSDPVLIETHEIPAKPTITLLGTPACTGDSVVLQSSASSGNLWSDGTTGNQTVTYSSGVFSVQVSSAFGCTNVSDPVEVTIHTPPAKPVITASVPGAVCEGVQVKLTSNYPQSNVWNTGSTTASITVGTGGTYAVSYTDANGCSAVSDDYVLVVNPLPAAPSISATGSVCAGSIIQLTSSELSNNTWSTGSTDRDIRVTSNGTYSVRFVDNNGCQSPAGQYTVSFEPLPATPAVSQQGDTMYASVSGNSYQWFDKNGPIAGATGKSYHPTKSGEYTVQVFSANGCASDTSARFFFSGTGISKSAANATFSIVPNPSNGDFTVSLGSPVHSGTWSIIDVTGKLLQQTNFSGSTVLVHTSVSPGIYFLMVQADGQRNIQRFEISK